MNLMNRLLWMLIAVLSGLIFVSFAWVAVRLWGFAFPFVTGILLLSATMFVAGIIGAAGDDNHDA